MSVGIRLGFNTNLVHIKIHKNRSKLKGPSVSAFPISSLLGPFCSSRGLTLSMHGVPVTEIKKHCTFNEKIKSWVFSKIYILKSVPSLTGNYHDSLSDAKAAIELQPTFLKAIVRGKCACYHV